MISLNTRLLLAASLVLAAFLGSTGLILDRAFRDSAETALRDRLQTNIYALLAAADLDTRGQLHLPDALPEARFSTPGSGLYAEVDHDNGTRIWRSPSALGLQIPFITKLPAGERRFITLALSNHTVLSALSFGVAWETSAGAVQNYTFSVAENLDGLNAQVQRFRHSLWAWLGGVALVLLAVQGSILRWSLAPLRRVTADLAEIEAGRRTELIGHYPRELRGLTDNLNALIRHERSHLERYRHTLDDLAHSLKTPLAVLRGTLGGNAVDPAFQRNVQEQVDRMSQIVQYQLQRAATSGRTTLTAPIAVAAAAQKVVSSLDKVYAGKNIKCKVRIDDKVFFHGDEGDLLELLGNLLDNAYKWCYETVAISAQALINTSHAGLVLNVEDDGPGIPLEMAQIVLQRGMRMDSTTPGQGIGLAVVQDIVRIYGGTLEIGTSQLGGAHLTVRLPVA